MALPRPPLAAEQLEDRTTPTALALAPPSAGVVPGWAAPAEPDGGGAIAPTGGTGRTTGVEHGTLPLYLPNPFDLTDVVGGFLTGPRTGDPLAIARDFITARAADMGLLPGDVANLEVVTNYATGTTGVTTLGFRQTLGGLPVKNTNLSMNVAADGSVINAAGYFVRDLARFAHPPSPALDAAAALGAAAARFGLSADKVDVATGPAGADQAQTLRAPGASADDVRAALVYAATPGGAELAWEMTLRTPDGEHWYDLAVSAATGAVLYANDYADHADYRVYPRPVESPNHGPRWAATDPWAFTPTPATAPSPFGWHDTNGVAGAEYTITRGNNVSAYADADDDNAPDSGSQPDGGAGLVFDFPIDLTQPPAASRAAAVANLFYWNNHIHDVTYLYGFNEAARNFQANNYGRGGSGNDAVQAEAQDGGGTDNANFATPPDGSAPRMQMYLGTGTTPGRDGALDNGVVVHEYGHGISNRLTNNGNGLGATQSGGMGEGWSDWFALMFTQSSAADTTAAKGIGTYLFGQAATGAGIRSYRYDFDIGSQANETFLAYGTGAGQSTAVHWAGTRWASALWDVTHLLTQKYGYEPNLYASTSPAGNVRAMHLVINGLKLQPSNPSFLQARDAVLQADQVLYAGANQHELWTAFARRGLGYSAATASSSASSITAAFDLPPTLTALSVAAATPGVGSVVTAAPAQYALTFTQDVNQSTLNPAGFTVDGTPATGFSYDSPTRRATFTFASPPATTQGTHTLALAAGAATSTGGAGVAAFSGTFRIDTTPLAVTGTTPAAGSVVPIDPGSAVLRVNFNEPLAPGTVDAADFGVSAGSVTGVSVVSGNQAVDVTVGGLANEGSLDLTVHPGTLADGNGGTNQARFTASYTLDVTTRAFPGFAPVGPAGSRQYAGASAPAGVIHVAADTDSFTLDLDPGQTITVVVRPTSSGLRPRVELFDPGNASVGGPVTAAAAGQPAAAQRTVASAGTYRVAVSSAAGTGGYTVEVLLNAAVETESLFGTANNTTAAAQSLTPAFVTETTPLTSAPRAAVRGATDAPAPVSYSAAAVAPAFDDITATGTAVISSGDDVVSGELGIGFAFTFYGRAYTSLYVSSNGLITFGGGTTAYDNVAMNSASAPTPATVAALWDDLHVSNAAGTARVKTQLVGTPGSRRFIAQWDRITYYAASGAADTITFQAVLSEGSNTIQLNYLDLTSGSTGGNEGASANVGVKDAGAPATQFLNVAAPGPNGFVGSGKSTVLTPTTPAPVADYYSFTAAAGDTATLAVLGSAPGNVDVQLIAADGVAVLAPGTAGATNLGEAVQNFPLPGAGTYFVRVTGDASVPYDLVVARNAAFGAEPSGTAAAAQPLGASRSALGAVTPAADADWYAVTLPAGATALRVETRTPGDGPGQFPNLLDPAVQVYDAAGTALLGTGAALADGRNEATTVTDLTPGASYTVRVTGQGATTGEYLLAVTPTAVPQPTSVLVNGTTAPAVTATASRLTSLAVAFSTPVSALDAGAFTLTRGATTLLSGGAISVAGLGTSALTLTFTGTTGVEFGSLADGVWTLTTDLSKVRNGLGVAGTGTVVTNNIRRLYGDGNGDGVVNLVDFGLFGGTFGKGSAAAGFNPAFNWNGDGQIDLVDFGAFGQRFGKGL